jgi:hypothetical protein
MQNKPKPKLPQNPFRFTWHLQIYRCLTIPAQISRAGDFAAPIVLSKVYFCLEFPAAHSELDWDPENGTKRYDFTRKWYRPSSRSSHATALHASADEFRLSSHFCGPESQRQNKNGTNRNGRSHSSDAGQPLPSAQMVQNGTILPQNGTATFFDFPMPLPIQSRLPRSGTKVSGFHAQVQIDAPPATQSKPSPLAFTSRRVNFRQGVDI